MFVIEYVCGWTARDMTKLCYEDTEEEAIKNIEEEYETTVRYINYVLEVTPVNPPKEKRRSR